MTEFLQVMITAGTRAEAESIARVLVEKRLAACVQVSGPITSVYRWQEKIEQSEEWKLTAKTSPARFKELAAQTSELHSCDCPEIVATAISDGSKAYFEWLAEQL
ncbi:MAG: divalent-cation tolerance protein CutA [Lacipirellulaceae bacterium]